MGNNQKKESPAQCLATILLFSIGVCILLFAMFGNRISKEDRVHASAVITDIRSYVNNRVRKFDVFVRYTVDGLEFESRMDDYFYGMQKGDVIKIHYDRNHPFRIQLNGLTYDQFWLLPAVLVFGYFDVQACRQLIETARASQRRK